MKKTFANHEIFLAGLIAVTVGLLAILVQTEGISGSINPLGWILLGTVVYTEVMQMFYDDEITMSLSGPILILALHTQPFWFVVVLVFVCSLAGKIFQTYYYHEREKVFDIRLVFNISQILFILALIDLLIPEIPVFDRGGFLLCLAVPLVYTLVNMILTGLVISLYQGRNAFGVYRSKSSLMFLYFHISITALLIYIYDLGGTLGCILALMVLIPMQGEILQRASIHKLNPKLVTDELTGAYNRSYMKRKVTEWLHHKEEFALLFMDLDDFKAINDTHGHIVGDEVLIHFVEEIRKDLRKADKMFRFGGDEFCILFQRLQDARKVDERWKNEQLRFDASDGRIISYTFSSGVVAYHDEEELNYYELLDKVDQQMYLEKKHKGDRRNREIS